MKDGESAGPFEIAGSYVVVQMKERKSPDKDWFEKHKDEQVRALQKQKWADVLDTWSKQRCIEARDKGGLLVNTDLLSFEGEGLGAAESKYTPCSSGKFGLPF